MKSYFVILINQVISFTREKYNTFINVVKRILSFLKYFLKSYYFFRSKNPIIPDKTINVERKQAPTPMNIAAPRLPNPR